MRLLIVRHAEAAPGNPDALRELTPAGLEHARALGEQLRARDLVPEVVLTSPLLRARQTADALELGVPEMDERLAPGATAEDVRAAATGRGRTVLVVGHQPDCGRIAAVLTGGPEPPFPPAGYAVVELHEEVAS
jgi:phosphohistidine phosphatase